MVKSDQVLDQRCAGVLLPISALPGPEDHGDFGQTFKFIEFLHEAGMGVWQVLPLGPTHENDCPYQSLSAHAGNPNLISLESLVNKGLLDKADLLTDIDKTVRKRLLRKAFKCFTQSPEAQPMFEAFVSKHSNWLGDFALFTVLREENQGRPWTDWEPPLRDRSADAIDQAKKDFEHEIQAVFFEQYEFDRQWQVIRKLAKIKDIRIMGDMPLFVAFDSADVWTNRSDFQLDAAGYPKVVAGVPPDYFSEGGQRWDNPLFAWEYQQEQGFHWWIKRFESELARFDWLRIDHFRGLVASWAIPASAASAKEGEWQMVPGHALLQAVYQALLPENSLPENKALLRKNRMPRKEGSTLNFIAEDLGLITDEVNQLRDRYQIPGMRVLQFAFDGADDNPHRPHNHIENCVLYTGTHDNNTSLAWFDSLDIQQQQRVRQIIDDSLRQMDEAYDIKTKHTVQPLHVGVEAAKTMPWPLIECALGSIAEVAIIPMQDLLELGQGHRTNTPGTVGGNWCWRFKWSQVNNDLIPTLHALLKRYKRLLISD